MAADLFISHRSLDDDVVNRLAARFEQETFDATPHGRPLRATFDHRDIPPGDSWSWWMLQQAREARYMAVLICPEITDSEAAMEEFVNHLQARQACLIPLWVRDRRIGSTTPEELPPLFRKLHYLDFRTESAFEASFPELLKRVRSLSAFDKETRDDAAGELPEPVEEEEEGSFGEAFESLGRLLCIVESSPNGGCPLGLAWVEAHSYVALPRRPAEAAGETVWVRRAMDQSAIHHIEAARQRRPSSSAWLSFHTYALAPLPPVASVRAPRGAAPLELGLVYLRNASNRPPLDYTVVLVKEWGTEGGLELGGTLESEPGAAHGALLFDMGGALVGSAWPCAGDLWIAQPFL